MGTEGPWDQQWVQLSSSLSKGFFSSFKSCPWHLFSSRYKTVAGSSGAVSVFSGHGGEDADNVAAGGGGMVAVVMMLMMMQVTINHLAERVQV